jgi:lipopolysaccharide transport system permease protein
MDSNKGIMALSMNQPAGHSDRASTDPIGPEPVALVEPGASRLLGLAVDAALAIVCYFAAYRLRFEGTELVQFLPSAARTLPLVAGSQVAAIAAAGTYIHRQGRRWLPRLVLGVALGTGTGALLTYLVHGFDGVSRISFFVDALLLTLAAFGWRSVVGLTRLARAARDERREALVLEDRSAPPTVSAGLLGILRYRELLRNLVLKDLKLKYRGSIFGFVWSLANPLLMVAVYTLAFTYVLRMRTEGFVSLLLIGLLTWGFFSSSAMMATGALVDSGGLIRSAGFPRAVLPLATVLFNLAQFLLSLSVLLPLALAMFRVSPSPAMLLFPVFLGLQILFTIGVALAVSTATAFFRDVRHLLEIALSALFWTTPIVYSHENVPEFLRLPILLSPVSPFVVAYQEIFYYGRTPAVPVWLIAFGYASAAFVLGASFFVTCEDQLAEHV